MKQEIYKNPEPNFDWITGKKDIPPRRDMKPKLNEITIIK